MFLQDWHSRLDLSSRASLYRNLSNIVCYKSHLDSISVVKFRIALTRLRIAAHRLLIETGRWVKPKAIALEDRKCNTRKLIEDEFHFYTCLSHVHIFQTLHSKILYKQA